MQIGIDVIEVERVKRAIEKLGERFLNRIFTQREIEYCLRRKKPYLSFAGRFAGKEAVMKALGTGLSDGVRWKDIEILNDEKGKPYVVARGRVKEILGERRIEISISHSDTCAAAVCIVFE